MSIVLWEPLVHFLHDSAHIGLLNNRLMRTIPHALLLPRTHRFPLHLLHTVAEAVKRRVAYEELVVLKLHQALLFFLKFSVFLTQVCEAGGTG